MALMTITKWQCDRCGEILDKRPDHDLPTCRLTFQEDGDYYSNTVVWKEMCPPCEKIVFAAIAAIKPKFETGGTDKKSP